MDKKVKSIDNFQCKDWLLNKHYAKRIPSISFAFGLFDEMKLQGVCTFGTPASSTLLNGICGERYSKDVIELNRLVVNDNSEKNALSFFVSSAMKMLPKPKIIVSYADTSKHHNGYIYQACNFIYTGLSSKFIDPKVIGLEHQHHATYAHGMTNKQLIEKFGDRLYFEDRARKHRYVFFTGTKKQKRNLLSNLNYDIKPYPKGNNKRYDASYNPQIQITMF